MGIFDFFKTSDTNKCKVCGDIIHSEFEICYSCKEKKKEIFENNLISPQDIEFLEVQGRLNTNLRVNAYDISKVDGNKGFYKGKLFTGIGFTLNEEGNVDMEVEFDDNGSMIETRMFHKNGQISSIIISNNDKWGGVINVEIKKFDEFGNLITN